MQAGVLRLEAHVAAEVPFFGTFMPTFSPWSELASGLTHNLLCAMALRAKQICAEASSGRKGARFKLETRPALLHASEHTAVYMA